MMKNLLIRSVLLLVSSLALPLYADQVSLESYIIQGSLCTGTDCVNGETFNEDKLRLKENNLRISLQDSSGLNALGERWTIEANDSSNGGLSYMAILMQSVSKDILVLSNGVSNFYPICDDWAIQGEQYTELLIPVGEPIIIATQQGTHNFSDSQICSIDASALSDGTALNPVCDYPVNLGDPASLSDGVIPLGQPIINVTGTSRRIFYQYSCATQPTYTRSMMLMLGTESNVALGGGSSLEANVISVGKAGLVRQIKHVSAAIEDTDLATVENLNETLAVLDEIEIQVTDIEAQLSIIEALLTLAAYAADNNQSLPSINDYLQANIPGINVNNLEKANQLLASSGLDTNSKVDDIATEISTIKAQAVILNFISGSSNQPPTLDDYLQLGLTGVTADNVDAINAQLFGKEDDTTTSITGINQLIEDNLVELENREDSREDSDSGSTNVYLLLMLALLSLRRYAGRFSN